MLEFERRSPATVANPDANSDVLFLDDAGVFYTKDSAGTLTVLGRGIESIAKTGTSGLVDTYTITFSGGDTQTYTVTNGDDGRSIVSIDRTAGNGAPGTTDTYTITYSEAPLTSTFTVYNGANGLDGSGQPAANPPSKIDPDDAAATGTRTAFYALEDHQHQIDAAAPVALGASASEGTSSAFARADHVHPRPTPAEVGVASFANIAVSGQGTIVADAATDTLTVVGSGSVSVTTDPATDTITIAGAAAVPQNCFANVLVGTSPTPTLLASDSAADTVTVNAGTGMSLTADAGTDTYTIVNIDTGSAARTAHEAAADPHPQYTTTAEASAAAPVQSVNGKTGAVSTIGDNAVTNTARSASFSTAVTTAVSYPVPANSVGGGHKYRIEAVVLVTNTTAASNLVATVAVGATTVVTLTQALGTTARTAQTILISGVVHFQSATSADGHVRAFTAAAVAFNSLAATGASAPIVATATATDVRLNLSTSVATSTLIVKSASIEKVK